MFSGKQRVPGPMIVRLRRVVSLGFLGGILVFLPWGLAQQPPTGPPIHVPSEEEFNQQELNAFAEAYVALEDLQGDREGRAKPGDTPEFSPRMRKEIEAHGLTVERYKRISIAMNRDMTLQTKVKGLINDLENTR